MEYGVWSSEVGMDGRQDNYLSARLVVRAQTQALIDICTYVIAFRLFRHDTFIIQNYDLLGNKCN